MPKSDVIDWGRFAERAHGVALDGTVYWRGTLEYGEEFNAWWQYEYAEGKTCPGPGFGEPECGKVITDQSERCNSCAQEHEQLANDPYVLDHIRERPAQDVDPVQYGKRLQARVQAAKLVAYARKKRGQNEREAEGAGTGAAVGGAAAGRRLRRASVRA